MLLIGKPSINEAFSMAMLNNPRVSYFAIKHGNGKPPALVVIGNMIHKWRLLFTRERARNSPVVQFSTETWVNLLMETCSSVRKIISHLVNVIRLTTTMLITKKIITMMITSQCD